MDQITLNLKPIISYDDSKFIVHAGVKSVLDSVTQICKINKFTSVVVYGPKRSGKTHFSIKIASELPKLGLFPRIFTGENLQNSINEILQSDLINSELVLIIDDAKPYFEGFMTRDSGEFVNLIETLRVAKAKVIMMLEDTIDSSKLDDHIMSRFKASTFFEINHPHEEDLEQLLIAMSSQRGIKIKPGKKLSYSLKRIGRDIISIENFLQRVMHVLMGWEDC